MKKVIYFGAAVALALAAGSAFAADLSSPMDTPVYAPPPPWTGFYGGLNAGYTRSESNNVNTVTTNVFGNPLLGNGPIYGVATAKLATFALSVTDDGFIGGGQIGYNYQFGNKFVAGIEADIQGTSDDGFRSAKSKKCVIIAVCPPEFLTQTASVSKDLDYLGTLRGRLGYLVTPSLLVYGTGGLAYGGVNASTSITQFITNAPGVPNPYSSFGSFSDTRVGWTAGGGGEWKFAPNWSVKGEYLFYDLGSETYHLSQLKNFNFAGTLFTKGAPVSSTSFEGQVVRVGLNFHFYSGGAPVMAK